MGFNDQLGPLIRSVWDAEKRLRRSARVVGGRLTRTYLTADDIYGLYGQSARLTHVDLPRLRGFFDELQRIRSKRGTNTVVQTDVFRRFADIHAIITGPDQTRAREEAEESWDAFFHFVGSAEIPVTRRVYVHARNQAAGLAILEAVVDRLDTPAGEGVFEVKIAGPGAQRLDTVIVYCRDDQAAQRMLQLLGTLDQSHFAAGVPAGTRETSTGVAVGDEPGDLEMWDSGAPQPVAAVSFGDFYSRLVHMALGYPDPRLPPQRQPTEAGSLQELEQSVKAAMLVAGVNPERPEEINRNHDQLEALLRNAQAALQRRGR